LLCKGGRRNSATEAGDRATVWIVEAHSSTSVAGTTKARVIVVQESTCQCVEAFEGVPLSHKTRAITTFALHTTLEAFLYGALLRHTLTE